MGLTIGLGITAAGFLFLTVLIFLMYKEAKRNFKAIRSEKEEIERNINEKISEGISGNASDEDDVFSKNINNDFNIEEEREKIRKQFEEEYSRKMEENNSKQMADNADLEEYKALIVDLVKDIHTLEEAYADLGGIWCG